MNDIAHTPDPPYYAVIFTSHRVDGDNGYDDMSDTMLRLASEQPGFLGVESAREGVGISVSYWKNPEAIKNWKRHTEHLAAQKKGYADWYSAFKVRICKVDREYGFEKNTGNE